jgi:hypothetical protein
MSIMIAEVYDAFRAAGVDEERSRKAAVALSETQTATKGDIVKLEKEIIALHGKITFVHWMIGLVIVVQVMPFLHNLVR